MPFRGISAKTVAKISKMFHTLISCFVETLFTFLALLNGKFYGKCDNENVFQAYSERCPKCSDKELKVYLY